MTNKKRIVLDANILIRAVLGRRVSGLLYDYGDDIEFFTTQHCFAEARQHLPTVVQKRANISLDDALQALDKLETIVYAIESPFYEPFYDEAYRRIGNRDPNDWPLVALALQLGCPVWTEDKDFFGSGIATWMTETVEQYLEN